MKNTLSNKNILVIGDLMLDEYIIGTVDRISPEAPVPVVLIKEKKYYLGGCGNVINNLASLHVKTHIISHIGNDSESSKLIGMLKLLNTKTNIIYDDHHPTTIKTRIISDNKIQMLRIDREEIDIKKTIREKLVNEIVSVLKNNKFDIIVLSDYNKGVLKYQEIYDAIYENNINKTKIIADVKPDNIDKIDNVFLIKPNRKEFEKIKHKEIKSNYILNTLGKDGMILYNNKQEEIFKSCLDPIQVYNVSGAGDTCIAVIATLLSLNCDLCSMVEIANFCSRYVVQFAETVPINYNYFSSKCKEYLRSGISNNFE